MHAGPRERDPEGTLEGTGYYCSNGSSKDPQLPLCEVLSVLIMLMSQTRQTTISVCLSYTFCSCRVLAFYFFWEARGCRKKRKENWDFLGIFKIFVHQWGSEWLPFKCSDTANVTKKEIPRKLDSWKIRMGKVIKMRIRLEKECKILDVRTECLERVERHRELRDF